MIRHLSYVACDVCGGPAEPCVEGAREARALARGQGFVRVNGRDLCVRHRPDAREVASTYYLDPGSISPVPAEDSQ